MATALVNILAARLLSGDGTYRVSRDIATVGAPYPAALGGYAIARGAAHGLSGPREEFGSYEPVVAWIKRHARHTGWLGSWTDSATGLIYLDCVSVVADRARAIDEARALGEIAVWDFAACDEIRVGA